MTNLESEYVEKVLKLWNNKKPLYQPFSGELVDEYGNMNSYYYDKFKKDLEYINSMDSYQFLEWLETASLVGIDNYLNFILYETRNTKNKVWCIIVETFRIFYGNLCRDYRKFK